MQGSRRSKVQNIKAGILNYSEAGTLRYSEANREGYILAGTEN
jgi:hypothetical protein